MVKYLKQLRTQVRDFEDSLALGTKLLILTIFFIIFALLVSGVITFFTLNRQAVSQIDNQLTSTILPLYSTIIQSNQDITFSANIPSNYFVQITSLLNEPSRTYISQESASKFGQPNMSEVDFPTLYSAATTSIDTVTNNYVYKTVSSNIKGSEWRVINAPLIKVDRFSNNREIVGYLSIGLPLLESITAVHNALAAFGAVSFLIIILILIFGHVFLSQALDPLSRIESAAARIARGDLSVRIPTLGANTELGSLALSLNIMLGKIEESFAKQREIEMLQKRFIQDASHELKTPIAAIRGFSELYQMGAVSSENIAGTINKMHIQALRLGDLTSNLLKLARLEEKKDFERKTFNMYNLIERAKNNLVALDETRRVSVIPLVDGTEIPKIIFFEGDSKSIFQAYTNIASNITKYTPLGSPVDIAVGLFSIEEFVLSEFNNTGISLDAIGKKRKRKDESKIKKLWRRIRKNPNKEELKREQEEQNEKKIKWLGDIPPKKEPKILVIEFRDHGEGINDLEMSRVFERFYRVESSRSTRTGGTGLGLSMVAAIIAAHNGSVTLGKTGSNGLTVRIILPTTYKEDKKENKKQS